MHWSRRLLENQAFPFAERINRWVDLVEDHFDAEELCPAWPFSCDFPWKALTPLCRERPAWPRFRPGSLELEVGRVAQLPWFELELPPSRLPCPLARPEGRLGDVAVLVRNEGRERQYTNALLVALARGEMA